MKRRLLMMVVLAPAASVLAACSALVDRPTRPTLYDLGPVEPAVAQSVRAPGNGLPAVILPDIDASGPLEASAVLYRLGYAQPNQMHAYSQARWSAPARQLVQQRLAELLGREFVVLGPSQAATLVRPRDAAPLVLRLELQDFVHQFETPAISRGQLRLRATLLRLDAQGERLVGQRTLAVQRPAPSPDAAGGVKALSAALDEAAVQLAQWLRSVAQA